MNRTIRLNDSVYDLSRQYPEIPGILAELGFSDILKPGMLQTAGRFMTIPKGAAMKKIDLAMIRQAFLNNGFDIEEEHR